MNKNVWNQLSLSGKRLVIHSISYIKCGIVLYILELLKYFVG